MSLIEGLGDEVVWVLGLSLFILVVFFAWLSTYVSPANGWLNNAINMGPGNVWLVQLHGWSNRSVQAIPNNTSPDATVVESAGVSVTTEGNSAVTRSVGDAPSVDLANTDASTLPQPVEQKTTESTEVVEQPSVTSTAQDSNESSELSRDQTNLSPPVGIRTRIRLKFLDETQKLVASLLSQTVGQFKREHFDEAVQEGQVVRLIYNGQLLRDDNRSLESYGLSDNCVVHCHVSTTPLAGQSNQGESQQQQRRGSRVLPGVGTREDIDGDNQQSFIGRHIFFVVGLNFLLLWLGWLKYSHHFDFTAFFSLVVCTVVYCSFLYASRRRNRLGPNGIAAGNQPSPR